MKTSWTSGLDKNRAVEIRVDFVKSAPMRERLKTMLEDKINTSNVASRNKENYALAGWPFLQADSVGYERALREVISLITDESVEK
jgi:hypothetical protein